MIKGRPIPWPAFLLTKFCFTEQIAKIT